VDIYFNPNEDGKKILGKLYDYCDCWVKNGWVYIGLEDGANGSPEYPLEKI